MSRKAFSSDVTDEEWAFVTPYLFLLTEDFAQREHPLREVFNVLRYLLRAGAPRLFVLLPRRWVVNIERLTQNPVRRRHFPQVPEPLPRALSQHEYQHLLHVIERPRDRVIF